MPDKISDEEFLTVYNNIVDYPTARSVGEYFAKNKDYVRSKIQNIRKKGKLTAISRKKSSSDIPITAGADISSEDQKTIYRLSEENKCLKKTINDAREHIHTSSEIRDLIFGVKKDHIDTVPTWVNKQEKVINQITPVLFITDVHLGEVVSAADMGFDEEYNTNVGVKSVNKVTDDFIDICTINMNSYSYPGCVLLLGGDGITGNLHDLAETNDSTPITQVKNLTGLYIQQIKKLEKAFGKVVVFAVTGNHGRLDSRNYVKTKKRTENSLETIVYHFVGEHFADNENVSIITDESDEILFAINGHRFFLTHGDRGISGGNGIGGIIVPIKRARAKMLQTAVAMNKEFRTLVIGHFHQHFISDELIIGNSIKPYDEYSKSMGFDYSSAGASSFFVNNSGDIIYATDIKVRHTNKIKVKRTKAIEIF